MPSDSGRRRAASGGALERRKTATANRMSTPATTNSVLRVRLFIPSGQESPSGLNVTLRPRRIRWRRGRVYSMMPRNGRIVEQIKRPESSILNCHRVRIDGFFAGNAFQTRKQAPIIALVGLYGKAALFPGIIPSQPDEVLFGF